MSRSRVSAASFLALGVVLAGVAFGAAGGTELGRTTVVELVLVLGGALVVGAAILRGRPGRPLYGAVATGAMAALAVFTALSVAWSVAPELSYADAGRMLAYLAIFAAAVAAARLAPKGAPTLLQAILLAASAVCAYALASRVWPDSLAHDELSNRIGQPYGYWNAVGSTAALAVPAALWLGSRRSGSVAARVAAYPALGVLLLTILLTESRGALAAALIGCVLWFAIVPLRLRSVPVLLIPSVGVAPVGAWALSQPAFKDYAQPLAVKQSVAGDFGLLLLALVVVLIIAGAAVNVGLARIAPPVHLRRRIGLAAVVVACALPLALFTSVAFSDRGLSGTLHDRFHELTSETSDAPSQGAGRLAASSNSRSTFWREAGHVFADRRGIGTGAATFSIARLRYRKSEQVSRHAHGFVPQTLSDLGLIGLALSLLLLGAWAVAAARATGFRTSLRRRGPPQRHDWTAERVSLFALVLVAIVFGIQSNIDWTWFVPGPAVSAMVAAGYVAGRGPLASLGAPIPEEPPSKPDGGRVLAAVGVFLAALFATWAIWQPEGSDRHSTKAITLTDQGHFATAAKEADKAEDANPLSPKPLLVGAALDTAAGRNGDARRVLERAVLRFPGDPQTWQRLSAFQLGTLDAPEQALQTVQGVLYLDPKSKAGSDLFLAARQRLRVKQARAAAKQAKAAKPAKPAKP